MDDAVYMWLEWLLSHCQMILAEKWRKLQHLTGVFGLISVGLWILDGYIKK